jgi:hypothetical protein
MGAFAGQRMPKAIKLDCEASIFAEKIRCNTDRRDVAAGISNR